MAPIDKSLIEISILNKDEKKWINGYHKSVYNNLKKYMNSQEKIELEKACSAI